MAATNASAQYYEDAACVLYEHDNYRGRPLALREGDAASFRSGQFWNDRASSIRVARRCVLVAYEHTQMRGDVREFRRDTRFVGNRWNDRISSVECYCRGYNGDY